MALSFLHFKLLFITCFILGGTNAATYIKIVNKCKRSVWPAVTSSYGVTPKFESGYKLSPGSSYDFQVPYEYAGTFWARTGCRFDKTGKGKCRTGDCKGLLECDRWEGTWPATTAFFSSPDNGYMVDLNRGYNVPISIGPVDGPDQCKPSFCNLDMARRCPEDLRVTNKKGQVIACKSACLAFGDPAFCCTDPYTRNCTRNNYTRTFMALCPTAASFPQDLPKTPCVAAKNFTITFC